MGAVLQLFVNGTWEPVAFFSKKLRPPQRKYSTFDRELLAHYLGIQYLCYFLEGQWFMSYTDHKPLTFCMSKVSKPWSNCQQHQLAYISEYTTEILHLQGKDNFITDMLSRAIIDSAQLGINYADMAEAQQQDPDCTSLSHWQHKPPTRRRPLRITRRHSPVSRIYWPCKANCTCQLETAGF